MKNTNKKGFTIVELVIVIAVIAILAAVLIPTFVGLVNKANVASDTALIKNLNTALAADTDGCKTMHEALEAASAYGYDVAKINAKGSNNEILWDSKNNVFCYFNSEKNTVEYIPDSVSGDKATGADLWVVASEVSDTYSTYLYDVENTTVTAIHSLDVGECEGIDVVYEGAATVTIRTNGGNLTVNNDDATVYHYGEGENLTVTAVAGNSYHEYGTFFKAEVTSGRVVVENGGSINLVIVNDATAKLEVNGKVEALYAPADFTATGSSAPVVSSKITADNTDGYTVVTTLEELKAVLDNAEVSKIALGADIVIDNDDFKATPYDLVVVEGREIELNLNTYNIVADHYAEGYTFSSAVGKGNNAIFEVKGNLAVTGAGKISLVHTASNMAWSASSAVIEVRGGELTLENGVTVEHLGGTDMAYGVDTYSGAVVNLDGATVKSTYIAIRLFNNSTTDTIVININTGIVDGVSRDIWCHNPSAKAVDANGIVNIATAYTYEMKVQDTFNNSRIYYFN